MSEQEPIDNQEFSHDKETCLEQERWLKEESQESEHQFDAGGLTVRDVCPECGRVWEYYYPLFGLYNPRTEEYEWTE